MDSLIIYELGQLANMQKVFFSIVIGSVTKSTPEAAWFGNL